MEQYKIGQYNNCRSSYYKKRLFKRMKQKKQISIDHYGIIFIYNPELWKDVDFSK
jgi:hypothetical protein